MSGLAIVGLILAIAGALAPRTVPEPAARRLALVGLVLVLADTWRQVAA